MINSYLKFQLVALNRIKAILFTDKRRPNNTKFTLFKEGEIPTPLNVIKSNSMNLITIFELELPSNYEFGKEYYISFSNFAPQIVDISDVTYFKEFDELFNYDGDDLGAIYHKEYTDFALWAPLASHVDIKLIYQDHYETLNMTRTEKGVYRIRINGDLLNQKYTYLVRNSGVLTEANDPYGKGTSTNSKCSGVVDIEAIKNMGKIKPTNIIKNYVDAIIYEVGIRDFTEQNHDATNIVNKGKYLGFIEEGRTTKAGHPAGLDYLKQLNITHVQLNPVIDFGSVDDKTNTKYNWGYDPISFFALEGNYSLHPEIPMERLKEFKLLVNKLHENNIRVILDVVYNHIYEHLSSCFEKILPNYYFRRNAEGYVSNASGCGDDVASEKYMVRKIIVDSMKYFVDVFDIDGYRFDLMGLLDIKTMKKGYNECFNIKPDIMMYGEGWNMGYELPYEEKACSDNANKLPMFGFFNDAIRDIIKGPTFKDSIHQKGYINGDLNYAYALKYAIYGSVLDVNYHARYEDANQSINYIECHDNNTLFDKLIFSNSDEDEETLLNRIKLGNGIIGTIFGVAFYHMGQEIGLSKKGNDNTYNVLDVNKMNWNLVDERYDLVKSFMTLNKIRRKNSLYRLHKKEDLVKAIDITEKDGLFIYTCNDPKLIDGYDEYKVIYNPMNKMVILNLEKDYQVVYANVGIDVKDKLFVRDATIAPLSMTMLVRGKRNA